MTELQPTGTYADFVNPPLIYVGGPIDFVPGLGQSAERYLTDRSELVRRLRGHFDPGGGHLDSDSFPGGAPSNVYVAWEGTEAGQQSESHRAGQERALNCSIALVAFLPHLMPTVGVPIEIYRVASSGRPAVVIGGGNSQTLAGLPGVIQVGSVRDAIGQIVRIMADRPQVPVIPVESPSVTPVLPVDLPVLTDEGLDWAMPKRHYPDDAGLDLYVTEQISIPPDGFADVPSGFRLQLPVGTFGLILGRSSTPRQPNRRLLVVPAVIDVGWRGPMRVGVINAGQHQVTIMPGERLAQLILLPNLTASYQPRHVSELEPHPRGENGFGSTGVGTPAIDSEASVR